jgi:hypothetical protein
VIVVVVVVGVAAVAVVVVAVVVVVVVVIPIVISIRSAYTNIFMITHIITTTTNATTANAHLQQLRRCITTRRGRGGGAI